jgi:hypothetical protein
MIFLLRELDAGYGNKREKINEINKTPNLLLEWKRQVQSCWYFNRGK